MNPIYRSAIDLDWMTIVLVGSLFLLAIGKYFFKNSFFTFITLPFNTKYLTLNKKKGKMFHGFHLIMCLFQIANLALLAFLTRNSLLQKEITAQPEFFGFFAIGILVFFLVKIGLQIGNGYFFENYGLMTNIIFEKLSYFNYGGLIAFLGNILGIYIFPQYQPIFLATILFIVIINSIGLTKILRNHQKLVRGSTFYFILYLCTLEIAPIAIIISYLNS